MYISRRRSAGGATGASKNVFRTLDITGSNVTRSRRELGSAFRGAAGCGRRWCRYPDDTVSRLLTITIDLALFYVRAAYYSNLFKSMPPRAASEGKVGLRSACGSRLYADRLCNSNACRTGRSTTIKRIEISDDKRV